jgi:nicotinamidase-related amidase
MRDIRNLNPEKVAVVLVDLQRGYCDPNSDCAQLLGWDVKDADRVCRDHIPFLASLRQLLPSKQIIWLKMEEAATTYAPNAAYGPHLGDEVFAPLCVRGTSGHEFHVVIPVEGEPQFLKFHPSGFSNKEFRNYLEANGITQLVFTGVVSSRCVNATVVTASSFGYECVILNDLISGPTKLADEMREHEKVTTFFYAKPMKADDFIQYLSVLRAQPNPAMRQYPTEKSGCDAN